MGAGSLPGGVTERMEDEIPKVARSGTSRICLQNDSILQMIKRGNHLERSRNRRYKLREAAQTE